MNILYPVGLKRSIYDCHCFQQWASGELPSPEAITDGVWELLHQVASDGVWELLHQVAYELAVKATKKGTRP